MQVAQIAVVEIQSDVTSAKEELRELNDLQLAIVGGGIGETTL